MTRYYNDHQIFTDLKKRGLCDWDGTSLALVREWIHPDGFLSKKFANLLIKFTLIVLMFYYKSFNYFM